MADHDSAPAGGPDIRVGTAGWTDRALLACGWYPPEATTPERRLSYYATRFRMVEVDATYYHPPSQRTVEAWRDRTPADFVFNVKAFSLLTRHPTPVASLYKDLRERVGAGRRTVYLDDVGEEVAAEVWDRFRSALLPLHRAGRLGAVLLQFPPWFTPGPGSREYILSCVERCRPLRACVEFRNAAWLAPERRERTLDFLAGHDIPYVCVDMPQGHRSSVPPVVAATADLAVVRFHGHSAQWESKVSEERYRYLYGEEELAKWAVEISGLAGRARTVHVIMNNCCGANAQRNAARLAELLEVAPPGPDQTSMDPPLRQ
ncbi:hypothetical protein Sru01_20820 [Sphaerisporangium rufum]|uniref:DUF72 domain-containing protein n=1 Tax=Sphaerisporangium rufum TaxID=1381558 RepID=A0A919V4B7_9ACTN|nr:DUF72 domain-containing protein [Sphaerisporangium rufum]GII77100.1 hypothetical protein Sru01_20820 [Sphaerisporangium rufum]